MWRIVTVVRSDQVTLGGRSPRPGGGWSLSHSGSCCFVGSPLGWGASCGYHAKQFADLVIVFQGVAQGQVGVELVAVATAVAVAFEVAGVGEFGDDALGGAFGDADSVGDVA